MSSQNFKYQNQSDVIENSGQKSPQRSSPNNNEAQNVKSLVKQKQTKPDNSKNQISRKVANPTNDSSTKGKLVEQHIKLKSQLKQLATKMDQILEKERERKKKKQHGNPVDDDERVQQLKRQLKQQQTRINKNKAEIARLRRNLDNKYDINKIVEKENELKHLKKQLQSLQQEKQSLQKIRKTQDKAIRNGEDRETLNKIARMEQELRQLTHKTKKQVQTINEKEKQVRKLHETYIVKQQKVREIEMKMKQKKTGNQEINEYSISQLNEQIKELESQREEIQKQGNQKIRGLERQRKQLKNELERKKLILEEKEKQLRLNQMKHKQIVRLINSSQNSHHQIEQKNQSKGQPKRTIAKKGREAPKIEPEDEDIIQQNSPPKVQKKATKKQKHDYGMSANLEDQ